MLVGVLIAVAFSLLIPGFATRTRGGDPADPGRGRDRRAGNDAHRRRGRPGPLGGCGGGALGDGGRAGDGPVGADRRHRDRGVPARRPAGGMRERRADRVAERAAVARHAGHPVHRPGPQALDGGRADLDHRTDPAQRRAADRPLHRRLHRHRRHRAARHPAVGVPVRGDRRAGVGLPGAHPLRPGVLRRRGERRGGAAGRRPGAPLPVRRLRDLRGARRRGRHHPGLPAAPGRRDGGRLGAAGRGGDDPRRLRRARREEAERAGHRGRGDLHRADPAGPHAAGPALLHPGPDERTGTHLRAAHVVLSDTVCRLLAFDAPGSCSPWRTCRTTTSSGPG